MLALLLFLRHSDFRPHLRNVNEMQGIIQDDSLHPFSLPVR